MAIGGDFVYAYYRDAGYMAQELTLANVYIISGPRSFSLSSNTARVMLSTNENVSR